MHCGLPNPLVPLEPGQKFSDVLGYDFDFSGNLPAGFALDTKLTIAKETAQIVFNGPNNAKLMIRKSKTDGDISGDYEVYPDVKEVQQNGTKVTVKGKGNEWSCAIWKNGDFSYSVTSSRPLSEVEITQMIEGTDK